mmetsp:Transcript_11411/g.26371  ORF Transcript_11411/g.26371 Transcript_11411/m.26371 type:complete len:233 (-) Transcript_11411:2330-3028(-)
MSRPDNGLELSEKRTRWSFSLHEPAHVVLHLALGELHALPLLWRESSIRWKSILMKLQDVTKGQVVVIDRFPNLVSTPVACLLLHDREQGCHLHNIVDSRKDQHGQDTLLIVTNAIRLKQTSILQHPLKSGPLNLLSESFSLLSLLLGSLWSLGLCSQGPPIVTNTKGKGVHTISIKPHEPEDGIQGPHRPLIFIISRSSTGGPASITTLVHIQRYLREGRKAILREHLQGV